MVVIVLVVVVIVLVVVCCNGVVGGDIARILLCVCVCMHVCANLILVVSGTAKGEATDYFKSVEALIRKVCIYVCMYVCMHHHHETWSPPSITTNHYHNQSALAKSESIFSEESCASWPGLFWLRIVAQVSSQE